MKSHSSLETIRKNINRQNKLYDSTETITHYENENSKTYDFANLFLKQKNSNINLDCDVVLESVKKF